MATSFSLGPRFEGFVKRMVESGNYQTSSEVMRQALRLLEEAEEIRELKLNRLRADVQEGVDSGEAIEASYALAKNRERLTKKASARGKKK